jgi:hypothetical protein
MAAAAAATARDLHEIPGGLLVEQVERRQTHIRDLFLTEGDSVARRELELLGGIEIRGGCRRTAHQSESQSGGTERRYRSLGHTLPLRSLLHPWHSRILHTFREREERSVFESTLSIILRLANMACKAAVLRCEPDFVIPVAIHLDER